MNTPKSEGYYQPAEWEKHEACWLAWPSAADLWQENLPRAQAEFVALCTAIAESEKLNILVNDQAGKAAAEKALAGLPTRFHFIPFGDIWLRDTAPLFLKNKSGLNSTVRFSFNGWGKKYMLPHDAAIAQKIADASEFKSFVISEVLEGGAVEVDGQGTCLTTKQCLLNPNRNAGITQAKAEAFLSSSLGVSKVLWLGDGLLNDHTDGHVDTLARFASPGVVLCMTPQGQTDPNRAVLEKIVTDLKSFTDAQDRKLKVVEVSSPGEILNCEGTVMPASYMNFYISNKKVIVPIYGSIHDQVAVKQIAACFPDRETIGLMAKSILSGGGAFHCITQQQPS